MKTILRRIGSILHQTPHPRTSWGCDLQSRCWNMLSGKPHAITAGLLESDLMGLFSICSTRYGCAKPRELQTLWFQPGWNDLIQAKLRAEAAGPSSTEESWSLKADCVNTGEGGERGILSPQQSPGACHLAPRMSTAGVFWGVKNTAHSTKLRVTSADSYTPTDFSNKYFQHLIETWCSQLYRNHKLKKPRSSSGKIENPYASFDGTKPAP